MLLLAAAVAGLTVLAMGDRLGLGGRMGWAFDLLSHWPKHLFLAAFVVGAVAGALKHRVAAGVAIAAAAVNAAMVLGLGGYALPQAAPEGARVVRVVSANIHGSLSNLEEVARLARAYDADIVSIYEAPEDFRGAELASLFPDTPNYTLPSTNQWGWPLKRRSLLLTREAASVDVTRFAGSHGVVLRATVEGVQVVTTHPPSPGDPGLKQDRDTQLAQLGDGLDQARPFMIIGDFNSTPWGRAFAPVPGVRAGDPRFEGTFPAATGWFGLPIDHVKFGGGLVLTDYRAGPDVGSDHLPLFATFALPQR